MLLALKSLSLGIKKFSRAYRAYEKPGQKHPVAAW